MSESIPAVTEEVVLTLPDISVDELVRGVDVSQMGTQTHSPSTQEEPPAAEPRKERRRAERREPHEFRAELRLAVAGFPMRLVNLSTSGLLAETNERLSPGRTVDVFLRYGGVRKVLRATVVRSSVHAISPHPVFRAALQFNEVLNLEQP